MNGHLGSLVSLGNWTRIDQQVQAKQPIETCACLYPKSHTIIYRGLSSTQ